MQGGVRTRPKPGPRQTPDEEDGEDEGDQKDEEEEEQVEEVVDPQGRPQLAALDPSLRACYKLEVEARGLHALQGPNVPQLEVLVYAPSACGNEVPVGMLMEILAGNLDDQMR